MIFGTDRNELRRMYFDAWQKAATGAVMSPLEAQIATVIEDHPEYQELMTDKIVNESFTPDGGQTNPFLHMGLHLAIREQVTTDRPPGIAAIFNALLVRHGNAHDAEHQALDCLAETLWEAQRTNAMPDETAYLERLKRLL
ncbi:MAG: DUF1841 family protein [Gammaproteobacteria bacterium]|nr:DUF1841 family protein [Gammaproteobacteria bacterium]